jgi:hypothetical protein
LLRIFEKADVIAFNQRSAGHSRKSAIRKGEPDLQSLPIAHEVCSDYKKIAADYTDYADLIRVIRVIRGYFFPVVT